MFGANSNDDFLSATLRQIAEKFAPPDDSGWSDPGKYGCDFENDAFLIHPDCGGCYTGTPDGWGYDVGSTGGCIWCDCHNRDKIVNERFGRRKSPKETYKSRGYWDPPNFWWKSTDLRITWYKYIGREMASNRDFSMDEVATIASSILGRSLEQIAQKHASDSRQRADDVMEMLKSINGVDIEGIHE